jgi:hypothetical protein
LSWRADGDARHSRPYRPAEFSTLGALVAVRCPSDLDHLIQRAGGLWEPGTRRWLVEPRRIGPLIRPLRRNTDPLFRQAGIDLGY